MRQHLHCPGVWTAATARAIAPSAREPTGCRAARARRSGFSRQGPRQCLGGVKLSLQRADDCLTLCLTGHVLALGLLLLLLQELHFFSQNSEVVKRWAVGALEAGPRGDTPVVIPVKEGGAVSLVHCRCLCEIEPHLLLLPPVARHPVPHAVLHVPVHLLQRPQQLPPLTALLRDRVPQRLLGLLCPALSHGTLIIGRGAVLRR